MYHKSGERSLAVYTLTSIVSVRLTHTHDNSVHTMRRASASLITAATTAWCLPFISTRCDDDEAAGNNIDDRKPEEATKLLRAQLVFRHGDRTPITGLAPRDERKDAWMEMLLPERTRRDMRSRGRVDATWERRGLYARGEAWEGRLTLRGAEQMRKLGEEVIRRRLIEKEKLLSGDFALAVANGGVKVRSTAVSRCVESAQSALLGGWPRRGEDENANADDASLRIEVRTKETETMFPKPGSACERLSAVFRSAWAPDASEERDAFGHVGLRRLRDAVTAHTGKPAGVTQVWDPLQCRVNHDMTLPDGVSVADVSHLLALMERRHFAAFASPEASPLIGSQLLREICDEMVAPGNLKLSVYAGHDSTLMALFAALGTLGKGVKVWPRTASLLIFETWRMRDGSIAVRAVYNGEPLALTPKSRESDGMTSYDDFKSFVDSRVPRDFVAACKL